MPSEAIKLGDEVEDVTAKVRGIAIGMIEHLDGSKAWLIQPPYTPDGQRVDTVVVQDSYAVKSGEGVLVTPTPLIGFNAREDL